jgi:hypothetical protein
MSHTAATFCIHVPMFDTNWAIHSARNTAWTSGAHGDVAGEPAATGSLTAG